VSSECPNCEAKDIRHLDDKIQLGVCQGQLDVAREEIARLRDFAAGKGMVSEAADMGEVAVLVVGLHAEIARLRALVAVGREMAHNVEHFITQADQAHMINTDWLRDPLTKWRSLEGK